MANLYTDLLGSLGGTPGGLAPFDFSQRNYVNPTDPMKISWNFYGPNDVGGMDNTGVNPVRTGPNLYNLGDDFYKALGYQGQAWTPATLDQMVSGGNDRGTINPEFQKWLSDQGYMYGEGMGGSQPFRGYFDKNGRPVNIQAGASDNSALEKFARDALGLYLGGQAFGAVAGGGGVAAGDAAGYAAAADTAGGLIPEYGSIAAYDAALGSVPAAAATSGFVGPSTGAAVGNALTSAAPAGNALSGLGNLGQWAPVVGGLAGAAIQNESIGDAIAAQSKAASEANALQKYIFDTQQKNIEPWMTAGKAALGNLTNLLNSGELTSKYAGKFNTKFDPSTVQMDPGYQFGLDQGQQAIANSAAARGMGLSGATLKAANRFGTDYATTKYNDAYNRTYGRFQDEYSKQVDDFNRFWAEKQNAFNPLFNMAGLGSTANQQVGQAGQNYANQVGATTRNLGDNSAASSVARGNVWGNLLGDLGGYFYNQYGKP